MRRDGRRGRVLSDWTEPDYFFALRCRRSDIERRNTVLSAPRVLFQTPTKKMTNHLERESESVVAIFDSRAAVEEAFRVLQRNNFEMPTVSFVCCEQRPTTDAPTYFNSQAAYPRDLWGLGFGFDILDPRIGSVFIAGAIAVRTAYDIEATFGSLGFDQLNASLASVAVPPACSSRYESELAHGRLLLIVDGSHEHVESVLRLLAETRTLECRVHAATGKLETPLGQVSTGE